MKVLIAIDDSSCSNAALVAMIDRGFQPRTEFKIITVIEPVAYEMARSGVYFESIGKAEKEFRAQCKQLIKAHADELRKAYPQSKISAYIIDGPIADRIIDEAESWQADLLVVGSHGRKGLEHFLLGSIAEKVVAHANCSVEVVKQKTKTKASSGKSKMAVAV